MLGEGREDGRAGLERIFSFSLGNDIRKKDIIMRKINLGIGHTRYLINNPDQLQRYINGAWASNQLDLLTAYIKLEQSLKTKFNG